MRGEVLSLPLVVGHHLGSPAFRGLVLCRLSILHSELGATADQWESGRGWEESAGGSKRKRGGSTLQKKKQTS